MVLSPSGWLGGYNREGVLPPRIPYLESPKSEKAIKTHGFFFFNLDPPEATGRHPVLGESKSSQGYSNL